MDNHLNTNPVFRIWLEYKHRVIFTVDDNHRVIFTLDDRITKITSNCLFSNSRAVQFSNGIQPLFDQSNTEPVPYSNPRCT